MVISVSANTVYPVYFPRIIPPKFNAINPTIPPNNTFPQPSIAPFGIIRPISEAPPNIATVMPMDKGRIIALISLIAMNIGAAAIPIDTQPIPYMASRTGELIVLWMTYPFYSFCQMNLGYIFWAFEKEAKDISEETSTTIQAVSFIPGISIASEADDRVKKRDHPVVQQIFVRQRFSPMLLITASFADLTPSTPFLSFSTYSSFDNVFTSRGPKSSSGAIKVDFIYFYYATAYFFSAKGVCVQCLAYFASLKGDEPAGQLYKGFETVFLLRKGLLVVLDFQNGENFLSAKYILV